MFILFAALLVEVVLQFVHNTCDQAEGGSTGASQDDSSSSSPEALEEAALQRACNAISAQFQLTNRESETLTLLAKKYTAAMVAEAFVITVATAKSHMRNIYAKLDIHSQQDLIELVWQERLKQQNVTASPLNG